MQKILPILFAACAALFVAAKGHAQAPPPYGEPITLEQARAAVAAAEAEAKKNNWNLTFAVVGPYGNLIYFQKNDRAHNATIQIAQDKARSAALFRTPTKVFMERLGKGETYVGHLTGVTPVAGGVPIVVGGKVIGAIGASGATADQDHQAASAGAAAVK
ncbi:MAG TPA: heme-binding protein [Xanthobacteraceae bacterium]|nr:heme-binding protein [Xanthobacteraceae bacterium]